MVNGCISISDFASLLGISVRIIGSAIGLKICATAAGIQKYKSIIKKREIKHDQTELLGKAKLNNLEVLISKV